MVLTQNRIFSHQLMFLQENRIGRVGRLDAAQSLLPRGLRAQPFLSRPRIFLLKFAECLLPFPTFNLRPQIPLYQVGGRDMKLNHSLKQSLVNADMNCDLAVAWARFLLV